MATNLIIQGTLEAAGLVIMNGGLQIVGGLFCLVRDGAAGSAALL